MRVKKWLVPELKELTQLWQVGVDERNEARESGRTRGSRELVALDTGSPAWISIVSPADLGFQQNDAPAFAPQMPIGLPRAMQSH